MLALFAFALIFMTIPGLAAEKMSSKTFIKKASSLNIGRSTLLNRHWTKQVQAKLGTLPNG